MKTEIPEPISYCVGELRLIDQTKLPGELSYISATDYRDVVCAIQTLAVRGAPAIGIAGAYAAVLAAHEALTLPERERAGFLTLALNEIARARPTAVNLGWAIGRIRARLGDIMSVTAETVGMCESEAERIADEDRRMCEQIGLHGSELISQDSAALTICNTGALATGGIGTALGAIYTAHRQGKRPKVFACETRPLLQGSRLTVWELERGGVDVTLIVDSVAGALMRQRKIDLVITGADRIAANGDTANKIGTYSLAVLASTHRIPFYVAAPSSTFDPDTPELFEELIEQRPADEVRAGFGKPTAPPDCAVYSPAFDITPRQLITGYITEEGIQSGGRAD